MCSIQMGLKLKYNYETINCENKSDLNRALQRAKKYSVACRWVTGANVMNTMQLSIKLYIVRIEINIKNI